MITVKNATFSAEFKQGDGIVAKLSNGISLFYSQGMVINGIYTIGKLRFVKDIVGNRNLISIEQHRNVPKEVYGQYRNPKEKEKKDNYCILIGISLPWNILKIEDIIYVLSGSDTFSFNSQKSSFSTQYS